MQEHKFEFVLNHARRLTTHSPPTLTKLQPIDISCQRTFQQAPFEPMGTDMGAGELRSLLAAKGATAAAVRQGQSNADPAVAAIRGDMATIQRIALGLPAEEQQELQQAIKDLRGKAEAMAEAAHLEPTETRAGKQERRRNGRPEGQRLVTALHKGRKHKRGRAALIRQQQQQQEPENCSDPFPKATRKGKPTHKVEARLWVEAVECWFARQHVHSSDLTCSHVACSTGARPDSARQCGRYRLAQRSPAPPAAQAATRLSSKCGSAAGRRREAGGRHQPVSAFQGNPAASSSI